MAEWNKIVFNVQNIQHDNGSSVLIKMPNKSSYKDYCFWHPVKLIRDAGGKGYFKSFSFHNEWTFKLVKKGQGKYNSNETISEEEIGPDAMLQQWSEK